MHIYLLIVIYKWFDGGMLEKWRLVKSAFILKWYLSKKIRNLLTLTGLAVKAFIRCRKYLLSKIKEITCSDL